VSPELKTAAQIMRDCKPKTLGEIFNCAMALNGCDEEGAWAVVDAHYKNHQGNREYRALAGLKLDDRQTGVPS